MTKAADNFDSIAAHALNQLAERIAHWALAKGFWDIPSQSLKDLMEREPQVYNWITELLKVQKLALVTTETSEMVEGLRKIDTPSGVEGFSNECEELADQLIRLLDYAGRFQLPIGECVLAKMQKNEGRPHRHGKRF